MLRKTHIFLFLLLLHPAVSGENTGLAGTEACRPGYVPALTDSISDGAIANITDSLMADQCQAHTTHKGLIGRIVDYFKESNKSYSGRGMDFSFIGGPYYSSDTKFGIGLVAAGLYSSNASDTLVPPSEVSLYLKATTSMFFQVGVRGTHIFPHDRARIDYDVNVASSATKFWGIGYYNDVNDDNEARYKYFSGSAMASYMHRIVSRLYLGPALSFDYIHGRDFHKEWLWEGQSPTARALGVGFAISYDTRDFLTNPFHGLYVRLDQRFMPRFLGNRRPFALTEFDFSTYHALWKDAILAVNFHTRVTYGDTPWGFLSTFGGADNMRGYFEGRYRDKGEFDFCVELRQHIWHRNGLVVWGGAGMVFPSLKEITMRKMLPNYGIGYRWEFKKRVNVRFDIGFGKNQTGFIFSINEAF